MRKLLLVFSCLLATVPAIQAEEHDRGERDNQSWNRGRQGDDHRDRDDRRYAETRNYRSFNAQPYVQSYAPAYYRRDADFDFRPNGYLPRGYVSQLRPYYDGGVYVPAGARCGVYGGRVIVYDPVSMLIFNVLSLAR